jgi:ABC-type lipoprotein release transport system permease subunit
MSSHIQVQDEDYLDKPRLRTSIPSPEKLKANILESPYVQAAGLRAVGFAILSSDSRTFGVQVLGVEPTIEPNISRLPSLIQTGSFFDDKSAYEIVIGKALASNLKIEIGDELSLLGQAKDGSIAAAVVKVQGIFESGSPEIDRNVSLIPFENFKESFGLINEASYIAVRTKDLRDIDSAASDISGRLSNQAVVVRTWDELIEGLKEAIELDLASGWLFYLSLITVVALSIVNTLTMAVLERTKEFGVLIALGARRSNIGILIMLEALLLATIGVLVGVCIGSLVVLYFGYNGFQIPGSEIIMKVWHMPGILYPGLSLESLSRGPRVVFLATILAAVYPSVKASRIQPLRALNAV